MFAFLEKHLEIRREQGTLRSLSPSVPLIDFTSNDYLGLANSSRLRQRILEAFQNTTFLGATGSRLLTGNTNAHCALEDFLAAYHYGESALLFASGYCANVGLLSALGRSEGTFILDIHCHASMKDGCRLNAGKTFYFAHNDLDHLEKRLRKALAPCFVCVESVYSMDGSLAPLKEITNLCENYGAQLIVDEAHATGLFGPRGEGCVVALGLQDRVFARIHTFGKALGVQGAAVIGSLLLKEYLCNFANSFIYTTAPPSYFLIAIRCAYEELQFCQRDLLWDLVTSFSKNRSPIQSVLVGDASLARAFSDQLRNKGFDVRAVVSPTVQKKHEILRICLHTFNSKEECSRLALSMQEIIL